MKALLGRGGVTLVELVIALALSSMVFIALAALTVQAVRAHAYALKSTSAQMNVDLAFKAIERELSEATYLLAPALRGQPGSVLEACANAEGVANSPPGPIDRGKPMNFFAFCLSGATLHHHSLPGCPAAYVCGQSPSSSFGVGARPITVSFTRSSAYSRVVEVSLTARSAEFSAARGSSFAVASAAGSNQ